MTGDDGRDHHLPYYPSKGDEPQLSTINLLLAYFSMFVSHSFTKETFVFPASVWAYRLPFWSFWWWWVVIRQVMARILIIYVITTDSSSVWKTHTGNILVRKYVPHGILGKLWIDGNLDLGRHQTMRRRLWCLVTLRYEEIFVTRTLCLFYVFSKLNRCRNRLRFTICNPVAVLTLFPHGNLFLQSWRDKDNDSRNHKFVDSEKTV